MQKRKKQTLDGIDREILRVLYKTGPQVSRKLAFSVGLTPSAIGPRLRNLQDKGIIKPVEKMKTRRFKSKTAKKGNKNKWVSSPRSIYWGLDLKNE